MGIPSYECFNFLPEIIALPFEVLIALTENEVYPHSERLLYTPSGRIGKVVDSHADGCKVARSNPGCGRAAPIYTMHQALRGYCL